MREAKRYIVVDILNNRYLFATNKAMIAEMTGISKTTLVNIEDKQVIKGYLILIVKRGKWL